MDYYSDAFLFDQILLNSVLPSQEFLFTYGSHHRLAPQLSEAIMQLCNYQSSTNSPILRACLGFIGGTLAMGAGSGVKHVEFFFSSDVYVFIDVVIREMRNLEEGHPVHRLYTRR